MAAVRPKWVGKVTVARAHLLVTTLSVMVLSLS
jgi:hypothetical protein